MSNPFRKIIHIDLDAFFCAVEELYDSKLVGKAFAVGGRPEERGVVASCSYPARRFGVRSAMPVAVALRLCPGLIIIPARHKEYSRHSKLMVERLFDLTPLVEQVSIDEAFLDVTDISEPVNQIALKLQKRINAELHLPCSLGLASNKLVAKIANDFGKANASKDHPANKITIVEPGNETTFLAPLKVDRLWGVGPKTTDRLNNLGILTIGDLAKTPEKDLIRLFGKNGHDLWQHANGIDDSPIIISREMKSISQEITFAKDETRYDELVAELKRQSDQVSRRLKEYELAGTTIKIKLRWSNFTTITRQASLSGGTNANVEIFQAALSLFKKYWRPGTAVRLIGVGVSGLEPSGRQLKLWDIKEQAVSPRQRQLHSTIDGLRNRFGEKIIRPLSDLDEDQMD